MQTEDEIQSQVSNSSLSASWVIERGVNQEKPVVVSLGYK